MPRRYGFLPENQEQANKIAHWLSYRGISFKVGQTCGKGRPIIDVILGTKELIFFRIMVGNVPFMRYANYYLAKEIAH